MPLTLAEATRATDAAIRHAAQSGWKITVVVVDEGGHLRALARMDGAAALTARIAEAKASGAAEFLRDGAQLAGMHEHREPVFRAASSLARMPLIPAAGSVVVRRDGAAVGAVGVSGALPEQDLECAEAGAAALA